MAKFCTKCGKKLEDGQVCDCTKTVSQSASQANTGSQSTGNIDFNRGLNDYLDIIKGIFTKPADTIKKYAQSNKVLA